MRRPVGVKWVILFFCWTRFFSPAELATVAMLPSALSRSDWFSLGACWAFSFQPVLPSVWRPVVSLKSRTWARRLTQSPELGFGFCLPLLERFCFLTRPLLLSLRDCCAGLRTLLRSPRGDAATPPAFSRSPRWLASFRFSRHARPASGPSAADHSPPRMVPECAALLAPAACAGTGRLPC